MTRPEPGMMRPRSARVWAFLILAVALAIALIFPTSTAAKIVAGVLALLAALLGGAANRQDDGQDSD